MRYIIKHSQWNVYSVLNLQIDITDEIFNTNYVTALLWGKNYSN